MNTQLQVESTLRSARQVNLATALQHHSAGRLDAAEMMYQQLYVADRNDSEVIYLMGVLCCDLGLFEAACAFLEQALEIAPQFPEARRQLSAALHGLADGKAASGALTDAQALLERARNLHPSDPQTLTALGRVALLRGDFVLAHSRLEASLALRADDAESLTLLGLARLQLGRYVAAERPLRRALALQPELNQARNNLGLALQYQERLAEARECFQQALVVDPAYRHARINLAGILRILGEPEEARRELESVLAAHPDAVEALNNLGTVLQDLGEPAAALLVLQRASALSPGSAQVSWNMALTQLQGGDFDNGWRNFEARWSGCGHLRDAYRMPAEREWRGEPLEGKHLLLWAEQGFGDTLQFSRFAQDVARRGATVTVLAPRELAELLKHAPGVSAVMCLDAGPAPPYDYHCPLMSLPYRLGVAGTAQSLHGTQAYLRAPTRQVDYWRQRLGAHSGYKVGIVWSGSSRLHSAELAAIDARRSTSLHQWAPILSILGCSFFSLQKGPAAAELTLRADAIGKHPAGASIVDFSSELSDFSATAGLITHLDLIISVDTAVAHLAGALGKPIWLLNRHDTCWRWLLGRDDSPWYSTLRQFRQPQRGDWERVFADAAAALAAVVGTGRAAQAI